MVILFFQFHKTIFRLTDETVIEMIFFSASELLAATWATIVSLLELVIGITSGTILIFDFESKNMLN